MEELMKLIEEFSQKFPHYEYPHFTIYIDGSGGLYSGDYELFDFDNMDDLRQKIKEFKPVE
jgi:hypothetical protein